MTYVSIEWEDTEAVLQLGIPQYCSAQVYVCRSLIRLHRWRVAMACQCCSGRVAHASFSATSLAPRPLQMSACSRAQASTPIRFQVPKSIQGQSLGCFHTRFSTRVHSLTGKRKHKVLTQAYNQKPEIADRVLASVPYLIPLCDGLRYGELTLHLDVPLPCN